MKRIIFLVGAFGLGIATGALLFQQLAFSEVFSYLFDLESVRAGIDTGHVLLTISVLLLGLLLVRCVYLGCRKNPQACANRSDSKRL
ncbi:MAG: hypothetical protein KKE73_01615 [Proteobacteria bacterium]|nr:hypothetical protein [Pseudomonadota bacterium]